MSDDKPTDGEFAVPALSADIEETDELIGKIGILARTQCDLIEAAAFLGVLPDYFQRFLATHPKSAQAWFAGAAAGRAGLKMQQFSSAKKGSARVQVWLGKQYLGQTEGGLVAPADGRAQAVNDAWDNLSTWRMPRLG